MEHEHMKILDLVDNGCITVGEAVAMIEALKPEDSTEFWLIPCGNTLTIRFCLN